MIRYVPVFWVVVAWGLVAYELWRAYREHQPPHVVGFVVGVGLVLSIVVEVLRRRALRRLR